MAENIYSAGMIEHIHMFGLDMLNNEIYLDGSEHYGDEDEPGVEFTMANKFIRNLNILQRNSDEPITIHMKTGGGCVVEGMAIYDAINQCIPSTTIINYTHASSMSSLILQAADVRIMMPHSTFMFHGGSMFAGGTRRQFSSAIAMMQAKDSMLLDIYVNQLKETGSMKRKSKVQIRKWLQEQMNEKEDVYLSAEETVKLGFADEIWQLK